MFKRFYKSDDSAGSLRLLQNGRNYVKDLGGLNASEKACNSPSERRFWRPDEQCFSI